MKLGNFQLIISEIFQPILTFDDYVIKLTESSDILHRR